VDHLIRRSLENIAYYLGVTEEWRDEYGVDDDRVVFLCNVLNMHLGSVDYVMKISLILNLWRCWGLKNSSLAQKSFRVT
jgi:hypothetical protein